MLDIHFIVKETNKVKNFLKKKNFDIKIINRIIEINNHRKNTITKLEDLRKEHNIASKQIAKEDKTSSNFRTIIEKQKAVSIKIKEIEKELISTEEKLRDLILIVPNLPHESVPYGNSSDENKLIRNWGNIPQFTFKPKDHHDIIKKLKLVDIETSNKLSGSRFITYTNIGAKLLRALISFLLDTNINNGYKEIFPPLIVNSDILLGTGNLPKFEEDLYKIENENKYLIPTAEAPLTNLHKNSILDEESLPVKYCAYTPCFRKEAGSYGKDMKGLIRLHQFNKVEIMMYAHPNNSYKMLESLLSHAEKPLQLLNIPYRVVNLCTGDLGFSNAKTYDIEVWMPFRNEYLEISSCSNYEDFQSRRANIKFKDKNGKNSYVHTLNGSSLAIDRLIAAIIENYQREDGTIKVPNLLVPYVDLDIIS